MFKTLLFICFFLFVYEFAHAKPSHSSQQVHLLREIQKYKVQAEEAYERGDYYEAQDHYETLLTLYNQEVMDEKSYSELILTKAFLEACLNDFSKAKDTLNLLNDQELSLTQLYRKDLIEAKILYSEGESKSALQKLYKIHAYFPIPKWALEERSFYLRLSQEVKHYFDHLMEQASQCFEAGLYAQASPLYEEYFQALVSNLFPDQDETLKYEILLKLAEAEFYQDHYKKCQSLLLDAYQEMGTLDSEPLYLLAKVSEQVGEYDKALRFSKEYLNQGPFSDQEQLEGIHFLVAKTHYLMGKIDEAEILFKSLSSQLQNPRYTSLCRFYLAKISLNKENYTAAKDLLNSEHFDFEKNPSLQADWALLAAEAHFHLNDYSKAIQAYEQGLSYIQNPQTIPSDALLKLSQSYLKLAENPADQNELERNLKQAEQALQKVFKVKPSDEIVLSLVKLYVNRLKYFKDDESFKKIEKLFEVYPFESSATKLQIGLLCAKNTQDPIKKEKIYQTLMAEVPQEGLDLALIQYFYGQNLYQIGLLKSEQRPFQKGIELLKDALASLIQYDEKYAKSALKTIAFSYLHIEAEEELALGYEFFNKMLQDAQNNANSQSYIKDYLYYSALLASKLVKGEKAEFYYLKGKEAIHLLLKSKEHLAFKDQVLYLEGTLNFEYSHYSEARHLFLKLIENYPESKWVADAWYWAAKCHDLENNDPQISREYRTRLYQKYPSSTYAAEAYFYSYPYEKYLQGDPQGLEHLAKMEELFNHSPYLIKSFYLLGLDFQKDRLQTDGTLLREKNLEKSLTYFRKASEAFIQNYHNHAIKYEHLKDFTEVYYQSLAEQAQVCLVQADFATSAIRSEKLKEAIEIFQQIKWDFENPDCERAQILLKESLYPQLHEKAEYCLATSLIKNTQIQEAEKLLCQMLERYEKMEIQNHYYLSRVYYELAMLNMAKEDYQKAIQLFVKSEGSQDESITVDQKVDLSIQQSLCYRLLNDLDQAMLVLSKVINSELDSALKVKAMYLRAEIYEIQGRKELAQKQLEASSKKEGQWARMSLDKLIADYGMN